MKTQIRMIFTTFLMIVSVGMPYAYGEMMEKGMKKGGMMKGEMSAMLMSAKGHHAAGKVVLTQDQNGKSMLMLNNIKVDRVPDGRVYLAKDADYTKGVELGTLKQFSGNVAFAIPSGVNPHDYNSVVIWCERFSVEIGHALFEK
ncbi:MAG: DM13 domain-containing protein [Nitrospirota bacterium]